MKKIFFLLLLTFVISSCSKESQVVINGNKINVEIADEPQEQSLGLMRRQSLEENSGMLFIFENEQIRNFWMKNTLIPLDMIWIDSEYRVVHIKANARPCVVSNEGLCPSYSPNKKALYVLELNSGKAEEYGISVGDEVVFRNLG